MLGFIKDKRFYIHLSIIIILVIVIVSGAIYSLDNFTRHGNNTSVPDFSGLIFEELEQDLTYENFKFTIVDSVYDLNREKGTVISQKPKAESKVKPGRNIYLTIVAVNPEKVEMPNLIDLSMRSATSLLQTYGLKVTKLSYVPDLAKNAVVNQKYKGEDIEAGEMIEKGTGIELVLGLGDQQELIPVPLLIGKTHKEAMLIIHSASLNMGEEHFEIGDDTASVRVYRQAPNYSNNNVAKYGTSIELWYKSDANFDFDSYLKNLRPSDLDTVYEDRIDTNNVQQQIEN